MAPSDGIDVEQLMKNADMALYRTKSLGRGTFGFFEENMHERLQSRHQIAMGLREAIANGKFELHYQPIVNVKTRKIAGCEALIRWSHPERGLIPASEFIPIAEECGLIGQIGDWVLKTACAEAEHWPDDIWVAVNISAAQFRGQDLIDKVTDASKGFPLSRLILEITETLLMKDREVATVTLERLRKMGVRFAIDDFGTGFSSLSYLQSFPFDKIKIDRSFVSAIANHQALHDAAALDHPARLQSRHDERRRRRRDRATARFASRRRMRGSARLSLLARRSSGEASHALFPSLYDEMLGAND